MEITFFILDTTWYFILTTCISSKCFLLVFIWFLRFLKFLLALSCLPLSSSLWLQKSDAIVRQRDYSTPSCPCPCDSRAYGTKREEQAGRSRRRSPKLKGQRMNRGFAERGVRRFWMYLVTVICSCKNQHMGGYLWPSWMRITENVRCKLSSSKAKIKHSKIKKNLTILLETVEYFSIIIVSTVIA